MLWLLLVASCLRLGADAKRVQESMSHEPVQDIDGTLGHGTNVTSLGGPPMNVTTDRSLELYMILSTATLECLKTRESGVRLQSKQEHFISEIWTQDFFLNVLTEEERHDLNGVQTWLTKKFPRFTGKWHIQSVMRAASHATLDWMKSVALDGFPGMAKVSHKEMEQGKPPSFEGSDEEWQNQMLVDEPFDFDARREACLTQAQSHFEQLKAKLSLELTSPCTGTASPVTNTCNLGTELPCPEGSACGVVSQSDPKLVAITAPMATIAVYGIIALICSMVGNPQAALLIPGQTEVGLVLGSWLSRRGHHCACEPQACEWSDRQQSCRPNKHAKLSLPRSLKRQEEEEELSLPAVPFVGYKCVVEGLGFAKKNKCKLTACERGDYEESFPTDFAFRGQQMHGRLGKVDRETFNCWGLRSNAHDQAKMNFDVGAFERFEVYKGLELRRPGLSVD